VSAGAGVIINMSDLQDKIAAGEITTEAYFDAWHREIEENERLNPGFHDRLFEHLKAKYSGKGVSADDFFAADQ
jgi:hypothetical protein